MVSWVSWTWTVFEIVETFRFGTQWSSESSSLFAGENFQAGAPADDVEEGWIQQLEFFKEEVMSSLRWIGEERLRKSRTDLNCFKLTCYAFQCFSMVFIFFGIVQTSFAHGPCRHLLGVGWLALVLFLCPAVEQHTASLCVALVQFLWARGA